MSDIGLLRSAASEEFQAVGSSDDLERYRLKFLGKKGLLTQEMSKLGKMSVEDRKSFGSLLNQLKEDINEWIFSKKDQIDDMGDASLDFDVTLPYRSDHEGFVHPINRAMDETVEVLNSLGFSRVEGKEIENEYYNFTALNTPELHPARGMQDSFYFDKNDGDKGRMMLRTHTTAVQARFLRDNPMPCMIFSIGKVFRRDWDATHTPMFHQVDCLCVDRGITFANMKWYMINFLIRFFGNKNLPIRFRPSFFPFTEPSAEIDIGCKITGENVQLGGDGWLELMGCGMVHDNVLEEAGINSDEYTGFACGIGIERLAMLKYNMTDLRKFYENDLQWLQSYGFTSFS